METTHTQIFGREHLNVNSATQDEIIKRFNLYPDLLEALQNIDHEIGCCVDGESNSIDKIQLADLMLKRWSEIQTIISKATGK